MPERWRTAMERALYGPAGFFVSAAPADHFRTSVHASPLFAAAVLRLVSLVDDELGRPDPFDVMDVGAGRGELLRALDRTAPPELRARLRLAAVERAPRPDDLPERIAWTTTIPGPVHGVLLATEWLDNVPVDVVELDPNGTARYVLTDGSLGSTVDDVDRRWLDTWWPLRDSGDRAEVGWPRDEAWASAVSTVERGLALCVDYGHLSVARPERGTLTGFRAGRQADPIPDGSVDLTAHVAMDSAAGPTGVLVRQREALQVLGLSGVRPPLELASRDPAAYVRALAAASQAAELTDPAGLGGHYWLVETVAR